MGDLITNSYVQLGAISIMLGLMFYFSKLMFAEQMKMLREKNKEQRELEAYIRNYMAKQNAEHLQVIARNTEVNEKLIDLIQKIFYGNSAGGKPNLCNK